MREASRIGFAQARIQARFGARWPESFWRELEAGRDLRHLLELMRVYGASDPKGALSTTLDAHQLEARLRGRWSRACSEVAGWYPESWQPSMRWLTWWPALPLLSRLTQEGPVPAWLERDDAVGSVAAAAPEERADILGSGPLAPLAEAWAGSSSLADAWRAHWRGSWPRVSTFSLRGLQRLYGILTVFVPGSEEPDGADFDAAVELAEHGLTRLFRRHAGTPVAGLAFLVLLALDYMRLRAALALARSFGQAGAP